MKLNPRNKSFSSKVIMIYPSPPLRLRLNPVSALLWLHTRYGRPEAPQSLHTYTSYSVLYDHCRKVPLWSAELISKQHISGSANRKRSKFQVHFRFASILARIVVIIQMYVVCILLYFTYKYACTLIYSHINLLVFILLRTCTI